MADSSGAKKVLPPPIPPIPAKGRFKGTLSGIGPRREEHRFVFHARVEAIPLDGRHSHVKGTTADISHRGLFISAPDGLQVDSLVVLKIATPYGSTRLSARVVHQIEDIGFGCEFIDVTPQQQILLSRLVALRASAANRARSLR